MAESRGPQPRAQGVCPVCRQTFALSLVVCPRHQAPLQPADQRPTDPHKGTLPSLFDDEPSELITELERRPPANKGPTPPPRSTAERPTLMDSRAPASTVPLPPAPTQPEPRMSGPRSAAALADKSPPEVKGPVPRVMPPNATQLEPSLSPADLGPEGPTAIDPKTADLHAMMTPRDAPVAKVRDVPTEPVGLPKVGRQSGPAPTTGVVGQIFDGYLTTGVLAEGGMGVVFEAQHPILGTQAVVKVLKKLLIADPVSQRRMLTEGQTLSALTHRNVVRVFGFGRLSDGRPWLLMERLVGESLYAMLKGQGPLSVDVAVPLMGQMAAGLEATHGLGVVHRDLKPDNLYVVTEPDGERLIKLIDFGIARPDSADAAPSTNLRTVAGHFVGTVAYGAPELFLGQPCSSASDVYALGCVFFEMLTGQRPFMPPAVQDLARLHLEQPAPRVRSLAKAVPQPLDDLIDSMLAKRPEQRPTIEAVRQALKPEQLSLAALSPVTRTPTWVWWALGSLGAVCAGLFVRLLR